MESFSFFLNFRFLSPQACRQRGIKYLVAPFEADAQLAYLDKKGFVAGCTQVIYFCVVW